MYAISGRSFRAIASQDDLLPGETFSIDIPEALRTPTTEEFHAAIVAGVAQWLDQTVQARGYDNIVSCASYANSTVERFQAEAVAAIEWRDAVYSTLYQFQADPPEGVATLDQVIGILPAAAEFGWPE